MFTNGPRISWMDLKLGVRMLVKYPGLTLVGSLAMAFAIAVGAAAFEFLNQVVHPALPLHEGDRVVGIRLWHTESNGVEEQALFDYTVWRGGLRSIEDLVGPNARLRYELSEAMRELSSAARSIRVFADLLERQPEALIRGRR